MKQRKFFLAILLCLALTASLFAGCGNKKKPTSSSSSSMGNASSSMPHSGSMSGSGSLDMSGSMGNSGNMANSGSMGNSGSMANSDSMPHSGTMNGSPATAPAAAIIGQEWNMILVNAQNPLPEGFAVETRCIKGYENRPFDTRAAQALEQMLADAEKAGSPLYLVSAHRTPDRQASLFQRKVQAFMKEGFDAAEAEKQAAQWVARPGTSEHNLGLAADLVSADWYKHNNDLTAAFEQTPHFVWLRQHCAQYGFVLRYPKGKEKVTGVTYEPWHYRYVGSKAAKIIMERGLTLEEYLHEAKR